MLFLGTLRARTTGVKLAVLALENPPVRSRMAELASPLDQGVVCLDHLERVRAVGSVGHLDLYARGFAVEEGDGIGCLG